MERIRKRELRELNLRTWAGEQDVFPIQKSLNSEMKKNTAFIRKIRTAITTTALSSFLQEIRTLSLHKYLSEIISACFEGLCKLKSPGEIATGVEIVSALHQRFGPAEFTGYMGWYIGRGLSTPDKSHLKTLTADVREREEKERLARQRVLLRVATELWIVQVLRTLDDATKPEEASRSKETIKGSELLGKSKGAPGVARGDQADAEPFPLEVLKDMLGHDREHTNLPLVVIFVKTFSWDILGVKTAGSEGRKTVTEDGTTVTGKDKGSSVENSTDDEEAMTKDPPIVSPELRQRFRNILNRYFEDVKTHLLRDQKQLQAQNKRNAEAYVRSGEVFEDRQSHYEKQTKAQEKLVANAQVLADAVGAEMPDLKDKDDSAAAGDGGIGLVKAGEYLRGQGEGAGIWEDEDERRFYENLIDLKGRVPDILLEDSKKKKTDNDEQVGKRVTPADGDSKSPDIAPAIPVTEGDSKTDEQSTVIANKSIGVKVDAILARFPELSSKDSVDETAMEFCYLNSKASRNRLVKAIQEVPKGRSDLLPLYSRLVATLSKYMPDVAQGLVTYLDDEFRSLQRRKQKDFLGQVRTQNVRYLAELTKFGVVPEHVIFHCLKVSLDDFSRMNIEIICNLLENCGRYLLRNPETSPRMASFLETLQRKKSAQHLGQQERMLIENAMYYVNPPERAAIQQKERTPLELFLRKLMYLDLSRRTVDKSAKQIRKLHWEEPEVVALLRKFFTKPAKIRYSNIHMLAYTLSSLPRSHVAFTTSVIDDVLESIILGLELKDFKFNQRRISEVKYLAELYVYRMVDSPIILDTMFKITMYGHPAGAPTPNSHNPLDLSDDFFRIRLICTLLEGAGVYFNKGMAKKKLDFFLTFFQFYMQTKDPLPMDIDFIVQDAYAAVRPQWKLLTTFEEAGEAFNKACKENYQQSTPDKAAEAEEDSSSDDGAEDEDVDDQEDVNVGEQVKSSGDEEEETGAEEEPQDFEGDDDEEEQIVVTRPEDEVDPEAEADFDREFAMMMAESIESRKAERKPVFDVPLPLRRAPQDTSGATAQSAGDESSSGPPMMKFSLLSRRGNKQQTRSIDLPTDSTFAVAMLSKQQAEREEQQRIKNLVLNYDLRDENEPDGTDDIPFPYSTNPNRARANTRANYNNNYTLQPRSKSVNRNPSTLQPNIISAIINNNKGIDKSHGNPYGSSLSGPRVDKGGDKRSQQRGRKLQLSDVDW
ncbi:nonsense-mediated mRNA decay factor [Aulographum hederae CBS 113979]|uniref:Nonsense-mediated mRNA decay factor n=1 Tax=Aulographum hederae CBS 113979 TaxID=1176131 RepID=A0A6G1HHJ1_9PEZI|nr:nonsense-mediated mRNA decay factor [Aulographum hederae CBS 113979]